MFFYRWIPTSSRVSVNPTTRLLLDAWGRHEASRNTLYITEAILLGDAPDSAIDKLIRSMSFDDIRSLIRQYGEKAVMRLLTRAYNIGSINADQIANLLATAIASVGSTTYLRDIEFFSRILESVMDIPGLQDRLNALSRSYTASASQIDASLPLDAINNIAQYAIIDEYT